MRQGGRKEREGVCGGCTGCSRGATAVLRVLQVREEGERRRRLSEPNRSWQLAGDKEDSRRGIQRRLRSFLCLSSSDKARWRAAEDSREEGDVEGKQQFASASEWRGCSPDASLFLGQLELTSTRNARRLSREGRNRRPAAVRSSSPSLLHRPGKGAPRPEARRGRRRRASEEEQPANLVV